MIIKKNRSSFKITIITLVFPYPKRGIMPGVENYVESFAIPLKNLGHDVRIITTYWNGKKKFDNYKGIPIIRLLDSKSLFGKLGSIFHLNNITFGLNLLLKRNFKLYQDSDVIIIPLAIGFTRFFKLRNIPIISCFLHYDRNVSLVNQFNLPFYHYLEKKQFNKHKHIITISNSSKKDIINFYGINKKYIRVLPIGVDTEKFNPSKAAVETRKKYGENILFCVGPFLKRKRIPILLGAMKDVIKEISDTHLILAGDGPYWNYCKELAFKLGISQYVTFLGFVETDDLSIYFASSDLFVFPSELEGFGQVILESMASGTPVICVNKLPMNKIIEDGGITFKVNNSKDLSLKILEILKNNDKLLELKNNTLNVAKKYDSYKVAEQYIDYFKLISYYY